MTILGFFELVVSFGLLVFCALWIANRAAKKAAYPPAIFPVFEEIEEYDRLIWKWHRNSVDDLQMSLIQHASEQAEWWDTYVSKASQKFINSKTKKTLS